MFQKQLDSVLASLNSFCGGCKILLRFASSWSAKLVHWFGYPKVLSSNSPAIWYISSITAGIQIYGLEFILLPAWGF